MGKTCKLSGNFSLTYLGIIPGSVKEVFKNR